MSTRATVGVAEAREPRDLSPTEIDEGLPPAQLKRLARGLTEYLFVDTVTPKTDETGLAHVYGETGKQYTVDAETGVCTCPDHAYNRPEDDDEWRCKHAYRVAVHLDHRGIPSWANLAAVDSRLLDHLGVEAEDGR